MTFLSSDQSDAARIQRALRAPEAAKWTGHVGEKVTTPPADDPFKRLRRHVLVKDSDGRLVEHRERVQSIVECPTCHADVELLQDTDGWTERTVDDGKVILVHDGYGPGMGECCDTLLTDDPFDGLRAWDVARKQG